MHEKCGPTVHVGAEKTQALVRRIPRFHHDVIQFIAQEIFDYPFIACLHFKEISQYTSGSQATLHHS